MLLGRGVAGRLRGVVRRGVFIGGRRPGYWVGDQVQRAQGAVAEDQRGRAEGRRKAGDPGVERRRRGQTVRVKAAV
jgi:hypothetical protein